MMNFARITRARKTKTVPKVMSDIMLEQVAVTGSISEDELITEGFAPEELAAHAAKARELASKSYVKQINPKY